MDEKKFQEELEKIKADLEELRNKIGMPEEKDITKLPVEAAKKVSETASDVVKAAMEIAEKAIKVVSSAAVGAVEGAKKALTEEEKQKPQDQTQEKQS